jgi:putative molybdopterin biosynthesis protein
MEAKHGLSVQEVAAMLNVGKSSVYNLIARNEIKSYNVGRKIRFTDEDVKDYINRSKESRERSIPSGQIFSGSGEATSPARGFVLCGQDVILDVLSNYMLQRGAPTLREYTGSYYSLTALYRGKVDAATAHLWDGDTDSYNVPYVRRLLPGVPACIVNLVYRMEGLYVAKGNPKHITTWADLARPDVSIANREAGAGARVLLDESLRRLGIRADTVKGYTNELPSHLSVASAVSSGDADAGIGIEKAALQAPNIDFVPIKKERYDLVYRKERQDSFEIQTMLSIIRSEAFRKEFEFIGGYDTQDMGKLMAET